MISGRPSPHTREDLIRAIRDKNERTVRQILSTDSYLVNVKDAYGEYALHYAVSYSTPEITRLITDAAKTIGLDINAYVTGKNQYGWSILHIACRIADEDIISHILGCLDTATCRELMQETPDNNDRIPALLIELNPNTLSVNIKNRLYRLSNYKSDLPLHQPIDHDQVMEQLTPEQRKSPLAALLSKACTAVNQARKTFLVSSTHCDSNTFSSESIQHHLNFIKTIRKASEIEITDPADLVEQWLLLVNRVKYSEKFSTGNCAEFAQYIAYQLIKDGIPKVETAMIRNGDHAFVVLNRKVNSTTSNPATWGDDAFVVDAWSGQIFPAREVPKKLPMYYRVRINEGQPNETQLNLAGKYNTNIHSVIISTSFNDKFTTHISNFYQCFPFFDDFTNPQLIQIAISITCGFLKNADEGITGNTLFMTISPAKAMLRRSIDELQKISNSLSNNTATAHDSMAKLINVFIRFSEYLQKSKTAALHDITLSKLIPVVSMATNPAVIALTGFTGG